MDKEIEKRLLAIEAQLEAINEHLAILRQRQGFYPSDYQFADGE